MNPKGVTGLRRNKSFPASQNGIGESMEFVREFLKERGIKGKEFARATLTAEEAVAAMVDHAEEGSELTVTVHSIRGNVFIDVTSMGEEFDLSKNIEDIAAVDMEEEDIDSGTLDALRAMLLHSFADNLKYHHKAGKNTIRMKAVRSRNTFLYWTLGAMALAVIVGGILVHLPCKDFNAGLDHFALTPIKTMYMNALKMCVAPVVFFSIIACVAQFSDFAALGRIGGKVIGSYLFTTMVAIGVGLGMFFLFQPGDSGMALKVANEATDITSQTMDVSLLDTFVNIVPTNFIKPFEESNMLQLIFMAVLCGIAVGLIGKFSQLLRDILTALNDLFLKVTTIIIHVMPVAIFCAICSMLLKLGLNTILAVMGMLGVFILGLVCMMVLYCLMMLLIGRLNPITFLKKYAASMLQVFSMSSSNASIPINMNACEKKLGISKRIYSLSIPLGATINMDGTCVHLAIFSLALAKVYGVQITSASILSLVISIFVLSMGAPGIPGAGLICLSVILTQLGVPVEAVGIVMGIDALAGMFRSMSNCLGDVAVTAIVAKSEGLIDLETYNS